MNDQYKRILDPFGMVVAGMYERIEAMDEGELRELFAACTEASTTNCWCYSYQAAKFIMPEVERHIRLLEKGRIP